MSEPLVEVRDLAVHFSERRLWLPTAPVRAVDGVTFRILPGQIVALVGESGSGKTTLARAVLGLVRPSQGEVLLEGRPVRPGQAWVRRRAQMVFQDAISSLSPRATVSYLLREPALVNQLPPGERRTVAELLEMVGLAPELEWRYPHQLSGGQARRVAIARALALAPALLIADEPTAGLDVSAVAAILQLLLDLRCRLGLTCLVITHDLRAVGPLADAVAVLYLGRLVEMGPTAEVLERPSHPYTRALLAAVPEPDPRLRRSWRLLAPGEIPSPRRPPSGCRFHPRCPWAQPTCRVQEPALQVVEGEHRVACHFWPEVRRQPWPPSEEAC
jgi:oligopeptide transport system ATP-binding protein